MGQPKENKKKRGSQVIENENNFNKRLDKLFDVTHKNAMELIQIEGDRQFLLYQRDGRQGRMKTIDKKLFQKEIKRNEKILKQQRFADKNMSKSKKMQWVATVPECGNDSSASSEAGEDYTPTKWHLKRSHTSEIELPSPNRPKAKDVVSSGLAAALDRTKTTDRNATYVISEALRSVGCNSSEVVLSRQTVRRKRMKFRKSFAENLKESFKADVPLIIHRDGKMMFDICGRPFSGSGRQTSCGYNRIWNKSLTMCS